MLQAEHSKRAIRAIPKRALRALRDFRTGACRLLILLFTLFACVAVAGIARADQQHFSSPDDAAKALVDATRTMDLKAALAILGNEAMPIISSGDKVADAEYRQSFVDRYDQMHRFVTLKNGDEILYIGAENYPFPIPLVKDAQGWYFNTPAGEREILYRRIGQDELYTIAVLHALIDAQKTYFQQPHDGSDVKQYAAKLFSTPGTQDGLYWKPTGDEPESPVGPFLAKASAGNYVKQFSSKPSPFHGYYYRILTAQGPDASGGASSFIVDGKMTGGFAFAAYPAKYRNSGVMSFIAGDDGQIYQKDLGPKSAEIVRAMKAFNPDSTWTKAE